ncbi:MAG: gliding motility-associated C-terminal domain-containing protein, partial [Bacteroidales bacterium]|nr:gliding motility-associated C-terminal domain-containing protein [Bacteroidales bacterium]
NYVNASQITIKDSGSIHFANSVIELESWGSETWYNYSSNAITSANSAGSLIRFTTSYSTTYRKLLAKINDIYHNVEISNDGGGILNGTYNKITLLGNNFLDNISETDTLVLANDASYIYSFYDTVKINEFASLSGTPCYMIYLQSGIETTPAIFDIKATAANLPNDTLWIDNVYVHGIKALNGADNAKLKKGNQSPDVDVAGSSWGYGLGIGNYNTGWAAMLPYQSGRTPNWDHDFYIPCLAFDIMLNSNGMLATYGATYEWRRDSLNSPIIASTPEYHALDSATYFLTMNYGNGCTATDNVTLIVTKTYIDTTLIVDTICRGVTYSQYGFLESDTGVFYQYLQGTHGCDSIVELTLRYCPLPKDTIVAAICLGGSYTLNGFNENQAGIYDTITSTSEGCDSLTTLILSINDLLKDTIVAAICLGSSYTLNGFNENQAGIYNLMTSTSEGCDSLATLILSINDLLTDTIIAAICPGSTYTLHGFSESQEGIYNLMTSTPDGCDSLLTLLLSFTDLLKDTLTVSICEGESYLFSGQSYSVSGIYDYLTQTATGCDSLTTLVLTVNFVYSDTIFAQICSGETYNSDGFYVETLRATSPKDTIIIQNLQTIKGCDSIITLILSVNPTYSDSIFAQICAGDTYNSNGFYVETSRATSPKDTIIIQNLQTINACDSIVTLILRVNPSYYDTIFAQICAGETYNAHNFVVKTDYEVDYPYDTIVVQNLQSVHGCDSLRVLSLYVDKAKVKIDEPTSDFCHEGSVVLFANSQQTDFVWNTGETSSSVTVKEPGFYKVTAYSGDCFESDSIEIVCECRIELSNVFTPNANGGNMQWQPVLFFCATEKYELTIYNRWGVKVFFTTDPQAAWNGINTITHQTVESGVYFCIINYTLKNSTQVQTRQTSITIIN